MQQTGQLLQADFFDNVGGLNLTDSPFKVGVDQSTGGVGFNFVKTGGIKKRLGHATVNSSADTQLNTLGLSQYVNSAGTKFVVRTAGTKWQNVDLSVPSFTNLTEDTTAAGSDFLSSSSEQQVVFEQFNNGTASILWGAGGGQAAIYGAYSTTKVTKNGVPVPTASSFTATAGGAGSTLSTGTYRYALVYRKLGTQATSNVSAEASVSITAGQNATLAWTLTNNDTTKYDKILVYRSALNGVAGFTTGDLVVTLASSATGYVDTGSSELASQNIPRAGSALLDNSELPTNTYKCLTAFKRRLVTAAGNTLYISDLNKSESWPTENYITVPSSSPITALEVISFTSAEANNTDEILCIFTSDSLYVITGDSVDDWVLKFIDGIGAPQQSLVVAAQGFLYWVALNGVYIWNGAAKPIYASRPIETLFAQDGDLDLSKINLGVGAYFRKENIIAWSLSHNIYGTQKYTLKLDLRLTQPAIEQSLNGRIIEGVFSADATAIPIYAMKSLIPPNSFIETLLLGDISGVIYKGFNGFDDGGSDYTFQFATKFHDCGTPGQSKRFSKVIVWVEEVGDWDLTLDYWADYVVADSRKTTVSTPISTVNTSTVSLWNIAEWDVALWDDYMSKSKGLVFNLNPGVQNATEGDAIRLQFRNSTKDEPITILGYSIVYAMKGLAK